MNPVAVTARSFRQVPGEHQELLRAAGAPVRFAEADRVGARKSVVGAELGVRQGSHLVSMIGR